jgi:hypothetical protein
MENGSPRAGPHSSETHGFPTGFALPSSTGAFRRPRPPYGFEPTLEAQFPTWKTGARERVRTADLSLTMGMLYQLSYPGLCIVPAKYIVFIAFLQKKAALYTS